MITAIFLAVIILSNAAGDVCLTKGMKEIGDVSAMNPKQIFSIAYRVILNRFFLLGVFFLAISFFSFLAVLSWADMSFVVPATSLVYVITIIGAKFILREKVNRLRWAGTLLVCLGVALICMP